MENVKLVLEDYKRRVKTLKSMKGLDAIADTRLRTKASCYRTIISELERALANNCTSEKDLRVCEVIASAWISVKEQMPPVNVSCLCLRNARRVCNLYFDGLHWYDDGFDSKSERQFTDVTHWVRIEYIKLPTTTN